MIARQLPAMRELAMNLIMHRSYETNAPARFYEYSDRIEMNNPDGLYGKVQPENFPHVNDYRNPVIAEAMKELGYVNRFNRGISMVQEELEANKNGLALFNFKDITIFKVTVMSADPKPENGTNGIESGTKNGIENGTKKNTNGIEKVIGVESDILALIIKDNRITKRSIALKLGIGATSASRHINSLKDKGIIERMGGRKGGYWRVYTNTNIGNVGRGAESGADGAENLSVPEKAIIALIKENSKISRSIIANKLGIGTTTVYRHLESLKQKGIIERIGGYKGGYWKIKQ